MMPIFIYLFKMLICSGILYLYYRLALQDKRFHRWNRFYLLASVIISLVVPLLEFTVVRDAAPVEKGSIAILQAVESSHVYLEEMGGSRGSHLSWESFVGGIYITVSVALLIAFAAALLKIYRLLHQHSNYRLNNIRFVRSRENGTPFSFLNFIFWNEDIDLSSPSGQQIFNHELAHVEEKHSVDNLFMQLVLIIFWCNPFFWIMRRELKLVHEFIADEKAVEGAGAEALAALILQSSYPNQFNSFVNPFFQTSIKRRLLMISKTHRSSFRYLSRLAALPLIALTIFAFTVRTTNSPRPTELVRPFKVIIDAGHGYQDGRATGAVAGDVYEDDLNLAIAKAVASANRNTNIEVILSRPGNELVSLQDRVAKAKTENADLFLSIHLSAILPGGADQSGMEILVSSKNTAFQAKSELFGSALQQSLSGQYVVASGLQKKKGGIFVLDKNVCPSVLIECGYLSSAADRSVVVSEEGRSRLAGRILEAIEVYAVQAEQTLSPQMNVENTSYNASSSEGVLAHKQPAGQSSKPAVDEKLWAKFLNKELIPIAEDYRNKLAPGTYVVRLKFTVEEDGKVSTTGILSSPVQGLGERVASILGRSPKWKPGMMNGKVVRSYQEMPFTIVVSED